MALNPNKLLGGVTGAAAPITGALPNTGALPGVGNLTGALPNTGNLTGALPNTGALPGVGALPNVGNLTGALPNTGNLTGALPNTGALPVVGGLAGAAPGTDVVPSGAVPGAVNGAFGAVPIRQGTTSVGQVTLNGVPIPDPPKNGLQLIVDELTFGIYDIHIGIKKIELKVTNLRLTVSLQLKELLEGLGSALGQTVGGLTGKSPPNAVEAKEE